MSLLARLRRSTLSIVLDWDGTLTRQDTMHYLESVSSISLNSSSQVTSSKAYGPRPSWSDIVRAYTDDYSAYESAYRPTKADRTTIAKESAWLASLSVVEQKSVRRVEKAGLFKGATTSIIQDVAFEAARNDHPMRTGWHELLSWSSAHQNVDLTILSVNWSATFIRQVMIDAWGMLDTPVVSVVQGVLEVPIFANEIEDMDSAGGSSGLLSKAGKPSIRTSKDKLATMKAFHERSGPEENGRSASRLLMYVGDSPTDFDTLLAADVGVCIRDEPMGSGQAALAETFGRVGVEVVHIERLLDRNVAANQGKLLYWSHDLLGLLSVLEKRDV